MQKMMNLLSTLLLLHSLIIKLVLCEAEENTKLKKGVNVAVIGAGMSGLSASWFLEKKGYNVTVFEKNDRVGGQVYTKVIGDGSLSVNDYAPPSSRCKGNGGDASEFGAVAPIYREELVDVAKELGVPYTVPHLLTYILTRKKEKLEESDYYLQLIYQKPIRLLIEVILFMRVMRQYPELDSPNQAGQSKDLCLPMLEFAKRKGFLCIAKVVGELLAQFGYGYSDTVPAAYYLKVARRALLTKGNFYMLFPCGLQSFLESIANTITRVNLGVEVTKINRFEDGTVEVIGDDGIAENFDHLVIASGLYEISSILDVSEEERDLFTSVKTIPYLTSYVMGNFTEDAPAHAKTMMERVHIMGNAEPSTIDHVNMYFSLASGAVVAWQILDDGTTLEEATDLLKDDLEVEAKLENVIVQEQELWANYFPHASCEACKNGYHDRVEALQGVSNTYYVDTSLSFHSTTDTFLFAKDLIERKF